MSFRPLNDRQLVIVGLAVGLAALVSGIALVGQGSIRHVEIFWPEKIEQTVAFQDMDGGVKLVGIYGTAEDNNPTLVVRTGFAYVLTVENHGDRLHRLYIDGFNVQTDLLEPGQSDTITIYPDAEGYYNYYDRRQDLELLGQLRSVHVVPSDGFTGFLRDMI